MDKSVISKESIKKLGSRIRKKKASNEEIGDQDLELLHRYRLSYKDIMSQTFEVLSQVSKEIYGGRIVTYRIKRFESVISKLSREPHMSLATMGDIAGCRCIVKDEEQLYDVVKKLESKLNIKRCKDYIKEPKQSGYKSYHIYTKNNGDWRTVEIQIRIDKNHDWATLLEITDLLFDVKVKEGQSHGLLDRFHYLRSLDDVSIKHKMELLEIEKKMEVYLKLTAVVGLNFLNIRKEWLALKSNPSDKYFILEVNKEKQSSINSYPDFLEAESEYLNMFKNSDSNIVLTRLEKPNFYYVSRAYSNYTFMRHKFEDDFFSLVYDVCQHWSMKGANSELKAYLQYIRELIEQENAIFEKEREKIDNSSISSDAKAKEWVREVLERVHKREEFLKKLKGFERKNIFQRLFS